MDYIALLSLDIGPNCLVLTELALASPLSFPSRLRLLFVGDSSPKLLGGLSLLPLVETVGLVLLLLTEVLSLTETASST